MGKRKSSGNYEIMTTSAKQQTKSYERSAKHSDVDKTTGDYKWYSANEKMTTNQRHVERGSRREEVRNEYETTEKLKIGNKDGYTEIQVQKRFRDVTYNNTSGTKDTGGCDKYLTGGGSKDLMGGGSGGSDGGGGDIYGCGYVYGYAYRGYGNNY